MPKMQRYGQDGDVTNSDILLGQDSSGETKTYTVSSLTSFIQSNAGVFKHHQNNASNTWTINHNLDIPDYLPLVNIKVSGGGSFNNVQAMGVVTYLTKDSLKIELADPASGYAYIKK